MIYSTHIFDGLDDWPTHVLHLRAGSVRYVGPRALAPAAAADGSTSGSLYNQVRAWLLQERAEERAAAATAADVVPMQTDDAPPPDAAPAVSSSCFASRFDRFGGASRQSMFAR